MKRTMQVLIALVGILLISFAVPVLASAEQCSPEGKICLLTEATPANPYRPPQMIQVAVASEATSVGGVGPGQLVQQGPPGGMSVWQFMLPPSGSDEVINITITAQGIFGPDSIATFSNLPVLGTVVGRDNQIKRVGKLYVATFSYTARQNVTGLEEVGLGTKVGEHHSIRKVWTQKVETAPGLGIVSVSIAVNTVNRFCKQQCGMYAYGSVSLEGKEVPFANAAEIEAGILRFAKQARPKCLKHVRKLRQLASRPLQPQLKKHLKKLQERCYTYVPQSLY